MIFPRFLQCSVLLLGTSTTLTVTAANVQRQASFRPLSVRGGADWYNYQNDYIEEDDESFYMQQQHHQQHHQLEDHTDDWSFSPPHVDLSDLALALRWTGEMNRQLHQVGRKTTRSREAVLTSTFRHQQQYDPLRGGGGAGLVYRIKDAAPATVDLSAEPLTLFHAKSPRTSVSKPLQGASRWGPELQAYLAFLTDSLSLTNDGEVSLIWTLAMIYLDRACSVETPRSVNTAVPCPFCTPRTVHRLILSALLLAVGTVKGTTLQQCFFDKNLQSLGIPLEQMQQMVDWMKAACGDPGLFVSMEQLQEWKEVWTRRFGNSIADKQQTTIATTSTSAVSPQEEFGTQSSSSSSSSLLSSSLASDGFNHESQRVQVETDVLPPTVSSSSSLQQPFSRTAIGAQ